MNSRMRYLIILFLVFCNVTVFAQTGGKIRIAIMDFVPKGEMDARNAEQISEVIRSGMVSSLYFEVIERQEMDKILKEHSINMSGAIDQKDMAAFGRISSVKQIVVGTVGKLYGKVIITLRLVDIETGKNIFANSLYTDEERVLDDIRGVIADISDNALIHSMGVSIDDIKKSIRDRNYKKAWFQLNRYRDTNPMTDELSALKREITSKLARQYYDEANQALFQGQYRDARDRINNAIAIENSEQYIRFRDRIKEEEERYLHRREMERRTRQEQLNRYGEDYRSPAEKIREYYDGLAMEGFFLGASTGIGINDKYQFDRFMTWWGFDVIGKGVFFTKNSGVVAINQTGYLGLNFRYDGSNPVSNQFIFQIYGSPFLSGSFKIAHLVLNLGLDLGGVFRIGPMYPNSFLPGITAGATALLEFKMYRRLGIFAGFKFDFEYFPQNPGYSFFSSRAMAGVVF